MSYVNWDAQAENFWDELDEIDSERIERLRIASYNDSVLKRNTSVSVDDIL